jgi:hypothetical protein
MSWIPALACLVIPVLLVVVLRNAWLRQRDAKLLREQHPNEPWLWRRDWAARTSTDKAHEMSWFFWLFAVMWNLISLPVVFVLRNQLRSDPVQYVFFLFPLVGVAMIVVALYQTLRRRKYRAAVCHFDALPIPLGRTLRGEVDTRATDVPEEGFLVRLTNLRRVVTSTGKSTTVRESILWQDEQRVGAGAAMPGPNGVRVPFRFALPADAEPADDRNARDRIVWRLEVSGEVPGIDYKGAYELPVFTRAESPDTFITEPQKPWSPPPSMEFGMSPTGADQVTIRSASRPADWIGYVAFFALWFGALWFIRQSGAPMIAIAFFILIGLFVAVWAVDFLTGRSVISADRTELRFRRSIFGTRVVSATEVVSIQPRIGATVAGRALYNLVAQLQSGRTSTIAWHLRTRRDAEMLAQRVTKSLGI